MAARRDPEPNGLLAARRRTVSEVTWIPPTPRKSQRWFRSFRNAGSALRELWCRHSSSVMSPEHTAEYTTDDLINAVFHRYDPPSQWPAVEPPSIASAAPVMKRACDEAK